jgi:lipid A 3-O-deacylase
MRKILPLLLATLYFSSFAQCDTLTNRISKTAFVRLNYENDYFTATDDYYTQGIKLESASPAYRYSPIMFLLPGLTNSTKQYGLTLVQDCFTPTSISSDSILKGNRPFAGYIYLGHYKKSANYYKKQMLTAEVDIGAIGACAECEEEQKAIHHLPGNTQPLGWQYQIGTGAFVNYMLRYEKALYADTAVDVIGLAQLTTGTVYDNLLAGVTLHLGKKNSYFLLEHTSKFQLYGVVQGWVQGVAYNGTMQGALFTDNSIYTLSYNQLSHIVYGDSYGLCFSWNKIELLYSVTHITNEIVSGTYHGWGHISITKYF